ncbi:MAG: hypothetical protein ACI4PF_07025 [Christensenellales bacterium]
MKTSRMIFLFTILNLICTIIFINFLPNDVIFSLTGNLYASEFINRWYNLIIPIAQVISCGIIFFIDVFHRDQEHKYRYLTAYVAVAFTTYILWILMFLQYNNFEIGVQLNWPWTIMILFPIALFLFAEGFDEFYYKPMTEFSIFGFSWVKSSPIVWEKTHKFSGTTCSISACTLIALAVVNELVWHSYWVYLGAFVAWLCIYYLLTILYSYCIAQNYGVR